jgi:predicted GH43/DUF377 family glycosyl hydrolase
MAPSVLPGCMQWPVHTLLSVPPSMLLPAVLGVAQLLGELPAASPRTPNCTFVADIDYNGGDVAQYQLLPPPEATRQARCCALCNRTPNCHAGVLTGASHSPPHACWLKGDKGSLKSNADVMSCWKSGVPVPPAGWGCNASDWTCSKVRVGGKPTQAACSAGCKAPPPPPPQCYRAKVTQFDEQPVISAVAGSSSFQQAFNPSWIVSSAGTGGKAGLIIRTQNCSATVGGSCVACAGIGPKASVLTFSELLNDDNSSEITPKFKPIDSHSLVFGPHDDSDTRGTEDPRVAFDAATGTYYMFYTCWAKNGTGSLCLASTKNPTDTSGGIAGPGWTRHGPAFPGNHKSGAMLIREKPPHYLISGAGKIFLAKSDNLLNWTLGDTFISSTLWGNPNVEAGPPPMRLSDGNYVFCEEWKRTMRI